MLIEVYQDTACPWRRIGKRHLELALERWQGEPVETFLAVMEKVIEAKQGASA